MTAGERAVTAERGRQRRHRRLRLAGSLKITRSVLHFVWSHPANRDHRVRALMRAVRFQVRARLLGRRTLAQLGERSRIWADLHRTSAARAVYANPPDYPEMIAWRRFLRTGDLFVDVGSNVGSYAVWAGELGASVIALEPAEDTFGLLLENIALNGYDIMPLRAAAGAACGTSRFTSGQDSVNRLDETGAVETALVTVDSLIGDRTVAGMKVDVEGFEIEVLRGCVKALSEQRIKLIQLEWNTTSVSAVGSSRQPVAELLAEYGYSLHRPDGAGCLIPVTGTDFGPDVFASPAQVTARPGQ